MKKYTNHINLLLIGMGTNAQTMHLPAIKILKNKEKYNINLISVIDLKNRLEHVSNLLGTMGFYNVKLIAAEDREQGNEYYLSSQFKNMLDLLVTRLDINTVIISTDPICQFSYVEWALKRGLHVLAEKPLTIYPRSSIDEKQARKIWDSAIFLANLANSIKSRKSKKNIIFMLFTQRRYNTAYIEMKRKIEEVSSLTGFPLTSVNVIHNDGQLFYPLEFYTNHFHGYNEGYGKLAHTGYHLIDAVTWLIKASIPDHIYINRVKVTAKAIRPNDIIPIFSNKYMKNVFPDIYNNGLFDINACYRNLHMDFGEVDVYLNYEFCMEDIPICVVNMSLLHSGLSQRTCVCSDPILQSNSRIKHEMIMLYQGPFLGINFEKIRETKDKIKEKSSGISVKYMLNGCIVKKDKKKDFCLFYPQTNIFPTDDRLECIKEFFDSICSEKLGNNIKSSVNDHLASIKLLSLSYIALARQYNHIENSISESITFDKM